MVSILILKLEIFSINTHKLLTRKKMGKMKTVFFIIKKYAKHHSGLGIDECYKAILLSWEVQNYCSLLAC